MTKPCRCKSTLYACINFSVNELLKIKEDLTKERDEQLQEIVKLREQLADASSRQHDLEITHTEANAKIQEVERRGRRLKVISFNQNPKLTSIKINLPPNSCICFHKYLDGTDFAK